MIKKIKLKVRIVHYNNNQTKQMKLWLNKKI